MDLSKTNYSDIEDTNEYKNIKAQTQLSEARKKLKSEHPEATQAVVDPSAEKPPRLTGRQRAKYPKLTASEDILAAVEPAPKATSSQENLLRTNKVVIEPFYAQLEEIRRVQAHLSKVGRPSYAQVHPQARR